MGIITLADRLRPSARLALSGPEPAVRVAGLDYAFGSGEAKNQVLFDVGIEIAAGQLVVLSGPSGAGKTTLLSLIGALRSVQSGHIEVLGRDLSRLRPRELTAVRRDIGFIFQTHNLFDALSAYENVKMAMQLAAPPADEMRRRGVALLERLGLGHRVDYKPRSLSTGESQRVAIARALVNRPRLILADEPTAALDRASAVKVLDLLKEIAAEDGAAILMVTHDHRIIERANRLVQLVDGRIASDVVLHDAAGICKFLRRTDLFKTLTASQLTGIAERAARRRLGAGETVIRAGDPGEELFVIARGGVRIVRDGQEVAQLGPGDVFGEAALLSSAPQGATVVAEDDLETYVLDEEDLRAVLAASPGFRQQLHRLAASRR
ncbi:MAG TPA: ATP-binding cassette domain-containing protein [Stellaceae bacterium]|nr:ATP-binding cassette domain-containing protein [Stellaceae bacterium]